MSDTVDVTTQLTIFRPSVHSLRHGDTLTKVIIKATVLCGLLWNFDTWLEIICLITLYIFRAVHKRTEKLYPLKIFGGVFFGPPGIFNQVIYIGSCAWRRRFQPCITLENRLRNDKVTEDQTNRQTHTHTHTDKGN